MSEKTGKKTKAELHEMLAEAVRNTQPQPLRDVQPEPERKTQPHKTRPAPKHTAKIKTVRASASRKQRRR
ncbi:MAG: hypothetical protein WBF73_14645 [Bradyrhizobium sp.]|jgi:hypothetical protein